MAQIIGEIFGRVVVELAAVAISGAINAHVQNRRANKSVSSRQRQNQPLIKSSLPQRSDANSSTPQPRAVLIASSNITFGNDCERLVNIAFQTSQAFPTMMGTYADVIQYLRKELAKQHPNEYFHIIIGSNDKFDFFVDDGGYFAEIAQVQYRVLIFTTKGNSQTKVDTHDANSQMLLVWK